MHARRWIRPLTLICLFIPAAVRADDPPEMKFNDVKEVAPGVYFRYSSISASDVSIPFGGCNNIWVVFEDYVVVIDANFPKEAKDVIAAVKKTTDKPIRYVLDTHHHGDHAYGNDEFGKTGASIIAQANCARLLRVDGPKQFEDAGKGPAGRKDIADSKLKVPNVIFDDKFVLDDGTQRIEFYFFGHAHTAGDAFAYLPKHKFLCTGDACVNGAFNFMGHGDSASWIRVLERAQQLDVKWVLPGHGAIKGKELLETQKRYFVELRKYVQKGIDDGQSVSDIVKNIDFPWYKDWTGVKPSPDNIKQVYGELTGTIKPWDLEEELGILEGGPSPTKDTPGWTKPRRIIIPDVMPARLAELKRVAPEVEFIPVKNEADAAKNVEDADAVIGFNSAEIVKNGKKLRWIQTGHAGVENELNSRLVNSNVVLTNLQRIHGPNSADQAFALLLALTREIYRDPSPLGGGINNRNLPANMGYLLSRLEKEAKPKELNGKTMLVVGLGGLGTQVARRANSFGMRVMAVEPKDIERPMFVFSIDKPAKLMELLPKADVVILACPLTPETRGLIGADQFKVMKKTAYLINIARGGLVKTSDLANALGKGQIAGAGLDVIDPEPLPANNALYSSSNCVITPHIGGLSPEVKERQWRLWRENVRRFVAGEPLLCVVDKGKGY
jgi:phosphoglycerate dehydrogenase-like enzyme/glyoxylase-like metal-dependent hydrolase (beta-lactamase superfamily II)